MEKLVKKYNDMCNEWFKLLRDKTRYDGFEPIQWVYRLGDNGYVADTDWNEVFKDAPAWAESLFFVWMDDYDDMFPIACELAWGDDVFGLSVLADHAIEGSDYCFGTEATEEGEV